MFCKDLTVTGLSITEDYYEYKATFRLCSEDKWMDLDLSESDGKDLDAIKSIFELEESIDEIRKEIMNKVIEAAKIESRNEEGKAE